MRRIVILTFPIDVLTKKELFSYLENVVNNKQKKQICTVYSSSLTWATQDAEFAKIIKNSSLNLADGYGILAAADFLYQEQLLRFPVFREAELLTRGFLTGLRLLLGKKSGVLPERLSGVDILVDLTTTYLPKNWRVFLLGGFNQRAFELKEVLAHLSKQDFSAQIQAMAGPENLEKITPEENKQIIERINEFKPHLLFVALGPVKQEKWIAKNLARLNVNLAMGVGGSFDLLTGKIKRAPAFVQRIGLEWLWRVFLEKRNLPKAWAAFPVFPLLVAKQRWKMIKYS